MKNKNIEIDKPDLKIQFRFTASEDKVESLIQEYSKHLDGEDLLTVKDKMIKDVQYFRLKTPLLPISNLKLIAPHLLHIAEKYAISITGEITNLTEMKKMVTPLFQEPMTGHDGGLPVKTTKRIKKRKEKKTNERSTDTIVAE